MSSVNPNPACCASNPKVSKEGDSGYHVKGTFETIGGMNTYCTGPANATSSILLIYDIFGIYPQTLQGADILGYSNPDHPFRVFMPDFFGDAAADLSQYPPNTEAKMKYILDFFAGPANLEKTLGTIAKVIPEYENFAKDKGAEIQKWGVMGHCWGGKVAALLTGAGDTTWDGKFQAAAQCHPSLVDVDDASKITVPMIVLASKDEDKHAMDEYREKLNDQSLVNIFRDQEHGWMASKADFNDVRALVEYHRGYAMLVDFFTKHV